jgi:UDP-MurNAc hydroxylase
MKIHSIGHASIFVETQDCRILMDPVLWDPFCEGLNESCPKRKVIHEKLPEFDFLVISHKHLDHFDVRSLAYLSKKVDVLIPKDKLIEDCLRKLGYSRIYPLSDFSKVRVGSTTMMTTRSDIPVPEFGMIFADETGVFWNAVDTLFSPQTIQMVRSAYESIDFLLTPWHISLEGKYQYNQSISFPFSLYGYLFNLINLIQPKAIAPGAQGFKYVNESSWQNQVVFPVTRERFCHDLKIAFPEMGDNIFPLDPGDTFTFDRGEYHHLVGSCQYVNQVIDDRECLDFSPVNVGNPLVDSNAEKYNLELMRQLIDNEILVNLPKFIQEHQQSLFLEHCLWNVIYQLEVVFPNSSQKWHIDFSQKLVQVVAGRNPKANLLTHITASGLCSLIQKKKDWDYLLCSGEYRTFHKVYAIARHGIISAENTAIKDPIELKFPSDSIGGSNVYRELERWVNSNTETFQIDEDSNPMLKLGNVFIKTRHKKSFTCQE